MALRARPNHGAGLSTCNKTRRLLQIDVAKQMKQLKTMDSGEGQRRMKSREKMHLLTGSVPDVLDSVADAALRRPTTAPSESPEESLEH